QIQSPVRGDVIRTVDVLISNDGQTLGRAGNVTKRLWALEILSQAHYQVSRQDGRVETSLVTAPGPKPLSIENYLRVVGLLYLFIGLFIFVRRWIAARAVHFYLFCLSSFVLCSFHFT